MSCLGTAKNKVKKNKETNTTTQCKKLPCDWAYPEGTENYNDEALGEAEEVSAFTYYPVDSSVLNNIVGSVQVRMLHYWSFSCEVSLSFHVCRPPGGDHGLTGGEQ